LDYRTKDVRNQFVVRRSLAVVPINLPSLKDPTMKDVLWKQQPCHQPQLKSQQPKHLGKKDRQWSPFQRMSQKDPVNCRERVKSQQLSIAITPHTVVATMISRKQLGPTSMDVNLKLKVALTHHMDAVKITTRPLLDQIRMVVLIALLNSLDVALTKRLPPMVQVEKAVA
jgi:hypothetical protein